MSFFDGLKEIWKDPTIRKAAIGYTTAAVIGTAGVTYAATRMATRNSRKRDQEFLNQPSVIEVNGELYEKMPDGTLVPYWRNH